MTSRLGILQSAVPGVAFQGSATINTNTNKRDVAVGRGGSKKECHPTHRVQLLAVVDICKIAFHRLPVCCSFKNAAPYLYVCMYVCMYVCTYECKVR